MENDNSNLAINIINSRKNLGLSQEALAEKANVSLSTIQRIEKGTVKPRPFTLKVLAETLDLDISELISKPTENENSKLISSALKKMNLSSLLLVFVPFINLIIPILLWKKSKEIQSKNSVAGKIISFQLLWSIVAVIGMVITLFLSNLLFEGAGDGLFVSIIFYLLAVLFNVFIVVKTSSQLNNESENVLSFIPNLF
ncbi:helix-turn-helix domain-containing protein [Psychroserpens sp.]|uniref:helix-turn-helix domain-containing protein n=1 Tax=Psychroserpens sp. TaxID=2020870 RepID=UPI001B2334B3|nr:helix-turn-helix domain-containing protein [Psychroserpens sp.]MBO6606681.1 helix-turn-helix domain-containing protein [Psychroserpens sp.]MBO6632678.1 helix-turn-helix domain-containing protein [Psychroserpens sp.]MBO6653385.1 helix-turn-helix domain-containing protein [Psychroserpens sp.]MBO6680588.1 helix-turn-helix domain-containing protein [Psychroserpens sp.]MBO6750454.1 helix-turn-helix domain-containing protein [Psychroserpens sp.]